MKSRSHKMGQPISSATTKRQLQTVSKMPTKRRRTELEILSEDSVNLLYHQPNGDDKSPKKNQTSPDGELIRRQNNRIQELLEENQLLKSRLADLEAQLSVFVEPTKAMVPLKKRNGIDERKTTNKKPVRTAEQKCTDLKLELDNDKPLTVTVPYSLYQRVVSVDPDEGTDFVETPSWRLNAISPQRASKKEINEEVTLNDTFSKRHLKMETEERRRKRWDQQWMSEQRRFERARRKQSKSTSGQTTSTKEVTTFFPSGNRIQQIEVTDNLPVVAWGCTVPTFKRQEFSFAIK